MHARFASRTAVLVALSVGATAIPLSTWASDPAPVPRITLTAPFGGQTRDRVVEIKGRVENLAIERLTLVVNGIPMSVAVENGTFTQPQVLSPGTNSIRAFTDLAGRTVEDATSVYAQVPSKDLRVTLTWDTTGTDVDLWMTGPDAEKILYSHREGKAGGILDTDVTSGFGPETYTQARLLRGTYRIEAHAYRIARPTRVAVTVVRYEGTPDEERRTFQGVLLKTGDVLPVGEFTQP